MTEPNTHEATQAKIQVPQGVLKDPATELAKFKYEDAPDPRDAELSALRKQLEEVTAKLTRAADAAESAIRGYRCHRTLIEGDGGGFPLTDKLVPPNGAFADGEEEMNMLVDAVCGEMLNSTPDIRDSLVTARAERDAAQTAARQAGEAMEKMRGVVEAAKAWEAPGLACHCYRCEQLQRAISSLPASAPATSGATPANATRIIEELTIARNYMLSLGSFDGLTPLNPPAKLYLVLRDMVDGTADTGDLRDALLSIIAPPAPQTPAELQKLRNSGIPEECVNSPTKAGMVDVTDEWIRRASQQGVPASAPATVREPLKAGDTAPAETPEALCVCGHPKSKHRPNGVCYHQCGPYLTCNCGKFEAFAPPVAPSAPATAGAKSKAACIWCERRCRVVIEDGVRMHYVKDWDGEIPVQCLAEKPKALIKYEMLIAPLRLEARRLGYTLAVHGSLARDIDLIAVPWMPEAASAAELAESLRKVAETVNGLAAMTAMEAADPHHQHGCPGAKPHGRLGWCFHLGDGGTYIDLAVMPRVRGPEGEDWHACPMCVCDVVARHQPGCEYPKRFGSHTPPSPQSLESAPSPMEAHAAEAPSKTNPVLPGDKLTLTSGDAERRVVEAAKVYVKAIRDTGIDDEEQSRRYGILEEAVDALAQPMPAPTASVPSSRPQPTQEPPEEVASLPNGCTLFRQGNKAGGHTYYSDEVGGGVMVWDTCLVSESTLLAAMTAEHARSIAEYHAKERLAQPTPAPKGETPPVMLPLECVGKGCDAKGPLFPVDGDHAGWLCPKCSSTLDIAVDALNDQPCPHKWKSQRAGGDPADAGSNETVTFCELCGADYDAVNDAQPTPAPSQDAEQTPEKEVQS